MKKSKINIVKFASLLVLILHMISLCSCIAIIPDKELPETKVDEVLTDLETEAVTDTVTDENTETETTATEETTSLAEEMLPLPDGTMEFSFLSGAGAWRTTLQLNGDGTFTGFYLDSEMGGIGEDHPQGSAYVCNFTGKFKLVEKIDEYSYKLSISNLAIEKNVGETWIEDGIKYIASEPYGIAGGTEFIFYLPETPLDTLTSDFLSWWPYRYPSLQGDEPLTTLSCYGIRNVATEDGFFGGYSY